MTDNPVPEIIPDPAALVERAIESVLDQMPDQPDFDVPDSGPRVQPWADVAAPPGKNKRQLDELLSEFSARVEAAPGARAVLPGGKRPAEAFFEKFSTPANTPGKPGSRKRRGRRGRGAVPAGGESPQGQPTQGGRNNQGGGQQPGRGGQRPPRQPGQQQPQQPRRPPADRPAAPGGENGEARTGAARRRRRGRGRRGGGGGGGAAGGGQGGGASSPPSA